jgi:hypothetical protein
MSRKNKNRNSNSSDLSLINMDATAKKMQSLLNNPEYLMWMQSGAAKGLREKMLDLNFTVIRNTCGKIPLVNSVMNARVDEIIPFCRRQASKGEPGYDFEYIGEKQLSEEEKTHIKSTLNGYIDQTGFASDPDREDDFMDYVQMFVRDTLTIDQVATEIQYNNRGEACAFWALDAATIKRVNPHKSQFDENVRYVQEIDNKIYNVYTQQDLIFDYKNKRSDLRFRGFGYSPIEMCIDLITTLLFGYNYVRDQLMRDKVPKGFISVMGDAGQQQLDSIRRYWYAAMSGAGGSWNIPILPSGKDGVGIEWKSIGQSNKDMEYHKLMMFVSSIVASVFGMDLAELGIKSDDSTALIGESGAPRIQNSRNRALYSMLAYLEQHINKHIRKITIDWRFKIVGINKEDDDKKAEIEKKQLATRKTINELREEAGDVPIDEDYANTVLNPEAIQLYLATKQSQDQHNDNTDQRYGNNDQDGIDPEDFFGKSQNVKRIIIS